MDQSNLFRKESMEHIQSPEQLNDYMHVTNPAMWIVLAAVIVLLAGLLVWGASARIESYAAGTAQVRDGAMIVRFDDAQQAEKIEAGMLVTIGETSAVISSVGREDDGNLFAVAQTSLADGNYPARVVFRQTQVLQFLFN